ncbi:MAG: methyltransferase domain-containing protein [Candidatus Dormibacteraeota bacterium]|nr:methyltransferase domain-containing protein [Candidatus Dormibacteraeota bacterium]
MPDVPDSRLLLPPEFPRANRYDVDWQVRNAMGPNPLWLLEPLSERLRLRPGMRVLDLGCGRAATSIFLAREFGVSVCAADLWIAPTDNARRIEEAGVADRVFPLRVEAHALPFADEWFDAVVSVDAYHYFGTDALYLSQLVRLLRPEGRLGICVPGTVRELGDEFPPHLAPHLTPNDVGTFKTPQWWAALWRRSGLVEVEYAEPVPDGWALWRRWAEGCLAHGRASGHWPLGPPQWDPETATVETIRMLDADRGATLGFSTAVARRLGNP